MVCRISPSDSRILESSTKTKNGDKVDEGCPTAPVSDERWIILASEVDGIVSVAFLLEDIDWGSLFLFAAKTPDIRCLSAD